MSKPSPEVIRVIYGPSLAYSKVMFLFGIPITAASLMRPPSGNYFDPLILLIIPAWFLYIYINIFSLLRKPRTSNFAFISGIDYNYRSTAANQYIKRKLKESFFSIVPCIVIFLPVRLLTVSLETNNDTFFICLCVCIEYCCMVIFFISIKRYSLLKPEKHDSHVFKFHLFKTGKHSVLWKICSIGTWGSNRRCNALIRRQWLYIFRYEWISFIAIFCVCLISGTCLSLVIPPESNTLSIFVIIFFPVMVFLFTTRTFNESALMIRCCPYYNVSRMDFFIANIVISSLLVLPYIALVFVRIWLFNYPFVNVFPVLVSFFALIYLHAYRSMSPELDILGIFQSGVLGISVLISVNLVENSFFYSLGFASIPIVFIFASDRVFSNSLYTS